MRFHVQVKEPEGNWLPFTDKPVSFNDAKAMVEKIPENYKGIEARMLPQSIPYNIWDDFWDNGYAPAGQTQQTHGYIEEYDYLTEHQKEDISELVYNWIMKNVSLPGELEIKLGGEDIYFENITHVFLDSLMAKLKASKLEWEGIPISFYSES